MQRGRSLLPWTITEGEPGDKFQAEHFVCLHDEKKGWIEVQGSGIHPNPKRELKRIPDTEFFQFTGTPCGGRCLLGVLLLPFTITLLSIVQPP